MNMVVVVLAIIAISVLLVAVVTRGFEEMFEIHLFRKPQSRVRHCVHCGQEFELDQSDGWRRSGQRCTCNHCYWAGQRDSDAAPRRCMGSPGMR